MTERPENEGPPEVAPAGDGVEAEPEAAAESLSERLSLESWPARGWLELTESAADPAAVEGGLTIAKRRRAPTVRVSPGEVSALVPDPPRSRRTVSLLVPAIEHAHWERLAKRVAEQAILSAKVIAGELPEDLEAAAAATGASLLPSAGEIDLRRGRVRLEWDENACAAAITLARRLEEEPGLLLTLRGMTHEAFEELVRQRAALSSAGDRGAPAYAQRPPMGPDQEPPPLELALESFWSAGPGLGEIETPVRPPEHPHSLLRRLGPSPFENASFPLIGLLATCYDLMTDAEVARAAAAGEAEEEEEAGGSAG